tara:strand:+ start:2086 stop:2775 length:690 start_codon:yes stop_codon:yes gene_type:complete
MTNVPRSEQFDDVYFSVQDGLAETRHVFLAGNNLPDVWTKQAHFTICETGFGTGLNFLATLKLWLDTPPDKRPEALHFISFERYPLTQGYIADHLAHWDELHDVLHMLLSKYPSDLTGEKYVLDICDGVTLTLFFGDVNLVIPTLADISVDCWFLDGFKPSSNPDMWSDIVFENMARLSADRASYATFTAAGFVRRALAAQGFEVRRVRGFGYKREMCVGTYIGAVPCA